MPREGRQAQLLRRPSLPELQGVLPARRSEQASLLHELNVIFFHSHVRVWEYRNVLKISRFQYLYKFTSPKKSLNKKVSKVCPISLPSPDTTKIMQFRYLTPERDKGRDYLVTLQVLRDLLLREGGVVRDQRGDEEELPVLPLQEVPRGGHEDRVGPARRGATQESITASRVVSNSPFN